MNNKPICGEWHGYDVMPVEFKDCLFEINSNKIKLTREYLTREYREYFIGFRWVRRLGCRMAVDVSCE